MWYKSGFWHTGGGWFKAILHSDETFESSSFSKTMVAEPYRQEGYGYRDYPDTSDEEETDLVDIEAWPEEGQTSLRRFGILGHENKADTQQCK